jgi:Uma2 family endonuclease
VVEVLSPSNQASDMEEKRQLYFQAGAKEFWLCAEEGRMRFFNPRGELKSSELFREFPSRIDVDII